MCTILVVLQCTHASLPEIIGHPLSYTFLLTVKREDNRFGSVRPSVCLYISLSVCVFAHANGQMDGRYQIYYLPTSIIIEGIKTYKPEVKAIKLDKRLQSYGHLKFCMFSYSFPPAVVQLPT